MRRLWHYLNGRPVINNRISGRQVFLFFFPSFTEEKEWLRGQSCVESVFVTDKDKQREIFKEGRTLLSVRAQNAFVAKCIITKGEIELRCRACLH